MGGCGVAGVVVVLLALLAVSAGAGEPAPPRATAWQPAPELVRPGERPTVVQLIDGPAPGPPESPSVAWSARLAGEAWRFEVTGRVPRLAGMVWSAARSAEDLSAKPYYRLEYRAHGLARSYAPLAVVAVAGTDAQGQAVEIGLLDAGEVLNDGRWHTVIGRRPLALRAATLRTRVFTRDSLGWLELHTVQFAASLDSLAGPRPGERPEAGETDLVPIDLGERGHLACDRVAARLLERQGLMIDGVLNHAQLVQAAGTRFRVGPAGRELLWPAEDASVNQAPAHIAGVATTRQLCQPFGRDDTLAVTIGRTVSEVYLLLCAELPKPGPRYALPPGPKPLTDIEGFAVELRYADGTADFAFPYSLADEQWVIQRMLGAYRVPADPSRRLEQIVLHNRVFGQSVGLAGVTVKTSGAPADRAPVGPTWRRRPALKAPFARLTDGRLVVGNRYYELTADCRQGFAIERLVNGWTRGELAVAPSSGLEVEVGDTVLTGRAFRATGVRVDGLSAQVELVSTQPAVPLHLSLRLDVADAPQLAWRITVRNDGAQPLAAAVRSPVIRRLRFGGPREDAWLCFPRYHSVVTNAIGSYQSANDRSFCLQFVDAYAPGPGSGLALLTRNQAAAPLVYGLGKSADGVHAFVEHPGDLPLGPGEARELPAAALLFHTGDWHAAYDAYRDWVRTWYQPQQAQDKDWFRRLFLMRVHLTAKAYSWAIPIYDAPRREYRIDALMAADQDYWRQRPEIVHLGGWIDYDQEHQGDFLGGDFAVKDYTGGAAALRGAVRRLQEHHGVPVSLYTIPDRCRKTSVVGQSMGERAAMVREDGSRLQDERLWYVCTEYEPWLEHYVAGLVRTQRETGVKALYVDVFGYADNHRCYAKDHGHPVPTGPPQATLHLLRRLRAALPADVAIWSEYPVSDVASQYLDGNITYYCLNWHEYFGATHDTDSAQPGQPQPPRDLYRYAFPGVRQFVFPCGADTWSSESKFWFLNGQPLYDCAWCLYASPHLERLRHSTALQREYADCFAGDRVTPDVPTLRAGVVANEFRGQRRTVWTLYNANHTALRGEVLAVPHRAGARYRDLWHGQPLAPVSRGGQAIIELALQPQELACILQE